MITITAILNAIEAHAERAIVPELRLIKKEVEKLRPSLYPDDQEHADALLLKLDRLLSDQVVVATEAGALAQGLPPAKPSSLTGAKTGRSLPA